MNKAESTSRWYTPWRRDEARRDDDPADFGTAFGLDLSMAEPEPAAAKRPPPPAREGWMRRLAARRKPLA